MMCQINCNELDIFKKYYASEIDMISANTLSIGDEKTALNFRYEQLHVAEKELLQHINRRTMEIAGRRAALCEKVAEYYRKKDGGA